MASGHHCPQNMSPPLSHMAAPRETSAEPRSLFDPLVSSNFCLFLPAVLYFLKAYYVAGLTVGLSGICSILYHQSRETQYIAIDQYMAGIAFCATVVHIFHMSVASLLLLAVLVGIAFGCFFYAIPLKGKEPRRYTVWHTTWHMFVFAGQLQVSLSVL